jgi:hypothetical protein
MDVIENAFVITLTIFFLTDYTIQNTLFTFPNRLKSSTSIILLYTNFNSIILQI